MAEQIDIASLNFDTDKLNQNVIETRKQIDSLRGVLTDYRKEIRENNKEIKNLEDVQKDLAQAGKESSKEYQDNQKRLKELTKAQEDNTKEVIRNESQLRNLTKEQRELNKIIDLQTKAQSDNTAVMESANEVIERQWENQNEAAEAARAMYALRKQLNPEIEEEARLMEELSKRIDEANEYNKQYNTENEERVKGIGKYKEQILEAINATGGFGKASKGAIPGLSGLTAGAQAFSSVPLIAIIGLLVQGFKFLSDQFKKTEAGMDAITAVTRPLNAVLDSLLSLVGDIAVFLSGKLMQAFKDPVGAIKDLGNSIQENIINRWEGFSKTWDAIRSGDLKGIIDGVGQIGTGVEDITDKINDFGKGVSDAYEKGKQLDILIKDIEEKETNLIGIRSRANLQIEKITESLRDSNLDYQTRAELAKERLEIEEQAADQERVLIQLKLSRLKVEESINGATEETRRQTEELIAQILKIDQDTQKLRNRNQRYISQAFREQQKQAEETHRAEQSRIMENRKLSLETFKLINEQNKESIEDEVSFAREVARRRLEILDAELKNKLITQEKYNFEKRKLDTELAEQEAEISVFYAMQTLNEEILALEQNRAEMKRLRIEDVRDTADEIDRIWEEQQRIERDRLEAGLIDRHEYNENILQLERERNEQMNELVGQWQAQVDEDAKLRRLLENEEILLNIEDRFERERELERQHYENQLIDLEERFVNGEIAEANYLKAIENLNKSHAKIMENIDREVYMNRLSLASQTFGNLSSIMGEHSEAGKAMAVTQATIDTYASAVAAYNAMAGIPVVGPALGAIASAAAIVSGLQSVRKIVSTSPQQKYTGGYTGDGGMFTKAGNVHRGEVVFNQADVRALGGAGAVEAMRPTSDLYGTMPTGVPQEQNQNTQYEMMAEIIGDRVRDGAEQGTNTGIIEGGENEYVRQKATF